MARGMCARCSKPLSRERLAKRKRNCYLCEVANKRESRQRAHESRVISLYGLKPSEYAALLESQGGHCALCPARGVSLRLAVDHDHKLGMHNRKAVRGLLCKRCNRDIGFHKDDPAYYERVAAYLREPPAQHVLT